MTDRIPTPAATVAAQARLLARYADTLEAEAAELRLRSTQLAGAAKAADPFAAAGAYRAGIEMCANTIGSAHRGICRVLDMMSPKQDEEAPRFTSTELETQARNLAGKRNGVLVSWGVDLEDGVVLKVAFHTYVYKHNKLVSKFRRYTSLRIG